MKFKTRKVWIAAVIFIGIFGTACGSSTSVTGKKDSELSGTLDPFAGGTGNTGNTNTGNTGTTTTTDNRLEASARGFIIGASDLTARPPIQQPLAMFGTVNKTTVTTDNKLKIRVVALSRSRLTGVPNNSSQSYACAKFLIRIKTTDNAADQGEEFWTPLLKAQNTTTGDQSILCKDAKPYFDKDVSAYIGDRGQAVDDHNRPLFDASGNPIKAPVYIQVVDAQNEWRCRKLTTPLLDPTFAGYIQKGWQNPCKADFVVPSAYTAPYPYPGLGAAPTADFWPYDEVTQQLQPTHSAGGQIFTETNTLKLPAPPAN